MNTLDLVREFHKAFGLPISIDINIKDEKLNRLRVSLLEEELDELNRALRTNDAIGVLDALSDLQYVLDGAYLSLGFHRMKDIAFREIHNSNMSKADEQGKAIRRGDGKILKSDLFTPPNLKPLCDSNRE